MESMAEYANSGTDSIPPILEYRGCGHLGPSILPLVVETDAFGSQTDFHVQVNRINDGLGGLKLVADFPVCVGGTHQRIREFERIYTWMSESQSVPPGSAPTTVEDILPRLSDEIEATFAKLVSLPLGWDGYNGLPVRLEVAEYARRFVAAIGKYTLLAPDLVPLSDGGLQLEWFVGACEIEVTIAPDGTAHVYCECSRDGRREEFSLGDPLDIEKIGPFFRELR